MYAVISGDVQVAVLTWKNNDPNSFLVVFKQFAEDIIDEPYDEYDLVQLAVDLFSRKYANLESEIFNLKFVRLLMPE